MEKTIVKSVLTFLNNLPECKAIKIHGSIYQQRGTPDVLCCYHGYLLMFEMKQPGQKRGESQKRVAAQWERSGAKVYCCDCLEDVQQHVIEFARGIEKG